MPTGSPPPPSPSSSPPCSRPSCGPPLRLRLIERRRRRDVPLSGGVAVVLSRGWSWGPGSGRGSRRPPVRRGGSSSPRVRSPCSGSSTTCGDCGGGCWPPARPWRPRVSCRTGRRGWGPGCCRRLGGGGGVRVAGARSRRRAGGSGRGRGRLRGGGLRGRRGDGRRRGAAERAGRRPDRVPAAQLASRARGAGCLRVDVRGVRDRRGGRVRPGRVRGRGEPRGCCSR